MVEHFHHKLGLEVGVGIALEEIVIGMWMIVMMVAAMERGIVLIVGTVSMGPAMAMLVIGTSLLVDLQAIDLVVVVVVVLLIITLQMAMIEMEAREEAVTGMEVEGRPVVMEEVTGVGQVHTTVQVGEHDHLPFNTFTCFCSCFNGTRNCRNYVKPLVFCSGNISRIDGCALN